METNNLTKMNTLTEKERQAIDEFSKNQSTPARWGILKGAEFLAELRKEKAPSGWVDINIRVPESGRCVLLYSKEGRVAEGAYNNVKGVYEQYRWNTTVNPTHWMYLPSPPSNKEEAPSEELVKQILSILDNESGEDESGAEFLLGGQYKKVATEVAKLLTPDVNAELLEALTELVRLKEWKDRFGKDSYYLCTQPSVWKKANEAIQNAQSK